MAKKPADSSSIAGQIASNRQIEKLLEYLVFNFLIFMAGFLGWAAATETAYAGEIAWNIDRKVDFDNSANGFWAVVDTGVYY
ncbi:MAG: hypothetical protein K2N72_06165, partial [Oscillospiraceae bacterium]|nr:hypothetical protein [Oscillospiraceae bacterium]